MSVRSRWFAWCPLLVLCTVAIPGTAAAGTGNPYNFYRSVADCAAAQQERCEACLRYHSCASITDLGDGNAECTRFAENNGRGYSLFCINLALAIDTVATCSASRDPACPRDLQAGRSLSALDHNAVYYDDARCSTALDACLDASFGTASSGTSSSSGGASGDSGGGCDGGEDSSDDSGGDVSCEDSGSSDSSDSGCDSSDGGGGDCEGDEGSSCDEGGGDCDGGGGGDCGGGGGGDCSAGKHGRHGGGLALAIAWAFLPLPFASLVVRRARRRRAARPDREDRA